MLHSEAVLVVEKLRQTHPAPKNFAIRLEARSIVFAGSPYGEQRLDLEASNPERVRAHWEGYVTQTDASRYADAQREPTRSERRCAVCDRADVVGGPKLTRNRFGEMRCSECDEEPRP